MHMNIGFLCYPTALTLLIMKCSTLLQIIVLHLEFVLSYRAPQLSLGCFCTVFISPPFYFQLFSFSLHVLLVNSIEFGLLFYFSLPVFAEICFSLVYLHFIESLMHNNTYIQIFLFCATFLLFVSSLVLLFVLMILIILFFSCIILLMIVFLLFPWWLPLILSFISFFDELFLMILYFSFANFLVMYMCIKLYSFLCQWR